MAASDSGSSIDVTEEKKEEVVYSLTDPNVVTKYKEAGDIVSRVMEDTIAFIEEGKTVLEVCQFGDNLITELTKNLYLKAKIEKGVAWPTCVSVNNCVGHNSPLTEEGGQILKAKDMVKIDMGVHIDGCIAVAAQTMVVGCKGCTPFDGPEADVVAAAYTALRAAVRLIKVGEKSTALTEVFAKVAADYGVNVMEGILSHQMSRFVIDGEKVILSKASIEHQVEEFTFEADSVFAIDVVMSTGEGKNREQDARTTVFKRAVDKKYRLKMQAARSTFNDINKQYATLPFSLRALPDEKRARLGIRECLEHGLVVPYPVLFEADDAKVAHFKTTVLIMPNGTVSLLTPETGTNADSQRQVTDPALRDLLQRSLAPKKKGKGKKKAKGGASGSTNGPKAAGDEESGEEEAK